MSQEISRLEAEHIYAPLQKISNTLRDSFSAYDT